MSVGLGLMLVLALGSPTAPGTAGPGVVEVRARTVDAGTTAQAVRIRLGESLDGWRVDVRDTEVVGAVTVELAPPGEPADLREVVLTGTTVEERSRELASAIVLMIEQHDASREEPAVPTPAPVAEEPVQRTSPDPRPIGWIGVGSRFSLGPPGALDPDYGLDVSGGAWLGGEHVQPMVQLAWARSAADSLTVDAARFGAGLAGGGALAQERLWLGIGAVARAAWTVARDRGREAFWISSSEVFGLAQVRGPGLLVLGFRAGVDLTLPPTTVRGQTAQIRYGLVRFMAGVSVGVGLGRR